MKLTASGSDTRGYHPFVAPALTVIALAMLLSALAAPPLASASKEGESYTVIVKLDLDSLLDSFLLLSELGGDNSLILDEPATYAEFEYSGGFVRLAITATWPSNPMDNLELNLESWISAESGEGEISVSATTYIDGVFTLDSTELEFSGNAYFDGGFSRSPASLECGFSLTGGFELRGVQGGPGVEVESVPVAVVGFIECAGSDDLNLNLYLKPYSGVYSVDLVVASAIYSMLQGFLESLSESLSGLGLELSWSLTLNYEDEPYVELEAVLPAELVKFPATPLLLPGILGLGTSSLTHLSLSLSSEAAKLGVDTAIEAPPSPFTLASVEAEGSTVSLTLKADPLTASVIGYLAGCQAGLEVAGDVSISGGEPCSSSLASGGLSVVVMGSEAVVSGDGELVVSTLSLSQLESIVFTGSSVRVEGGTYVDTIEIELTSIGASIEVRDAYLPGYLTVRAVEEPPEYVESFIVWWGLRVEGGIPGLYIGLPAIPGAAALLYTEDGEIVNVEPVFVEESRVYVEYSGDGVYFLAAAEGYRETVTVTTTVTITVTEREQVTVTVEKTITETVPESVGGGAEDTETVAPVPEAGQPLPAGIPGIGGAPGGVAGGAERLEDDSLSFTMLALAGIALSLPIISYIILGRRG